MTGPPGWQINLPSSAACDVINVGQQHPTNALVERPYRYPLFTVAMVTSISSTLVERPYRYPLFTVAMVTSISSTLVERP
jgi:hypothetical protein